MILKKIPHQFYYFFELTVLSSGFFIIFLLSYNLYLQAATLGLILSFYSLLGIVHHKIHHALRRKIVIEYILVSTVIFAVFIFLNIGKL